MAKGLSTTLVLIVTIVVLLIVALVLLTVFGSTITSIASVGEGKAQCGMVFGAFCFKVSDTAGCASTPSTWGAKLFKMGDTSYACQNTQLCGDWGGGTGAGACSWHAETKTCTFTCD